MRWVAPGLKLLVRGHITKTERGVPSGSIRLVSHVARLAVPANKPSHTA